jgi:RNA polymerase subunit RPABC4/transcription elongation factor Spt4
MARIERCAACKSAVPADATFCPGCGRNIAKEGRGYALDVFIDEEPVGGGSLVMVGGGRNRGRRELAIIGGAILVVVIVVAVVGHRRSGTDRAASLPTTALATTTTGPAANGAGTTSELPTTTAAVDGSGPLFDRPTGLQLVGYGTDGLFRRIDVDSGLITTVLPDTPIFTNAAMALDGAIVVILNSGLWVYPEGAPAGLQVGPVLSMLGPAGRHAVWVLVSADNGRLGMYRVGADGARLDVGLAVPALTKAVGAAGVQGPLVEANGGGVYLVAPDGSTPRRVAEGSFLTANNDRIATVSCDETLTCSLVVTSVAGGVEHSTQLQAGDLNGYFPTLVAALSPDGSRLAYVNQGARQAQLRVLDLVDNRVLFEGPWERADDLVLSSNPLVWSPDSNFLAWADKDGLQILDAGAGRGPTQIARPLLDKMTGVVPA